MVLTGALGPGDEGLARVAHLEDGRRLDVVPLLKGEGVHAVTLQPQIRCGPTTVGGPRG